MKPKKFLVFSDLHITNKNSKFRVDGDGVSDLIKAQYEFVDWMCKEVEDGNFGKISGILFLGDLTDYSTLDPITAGYTNKVVGRLLRCGLPLLMIGGNHTIDDQGNKFGVVSSFQPLFETDGPPYFCTSQNIVDIDGVKFWTFPYVSDYKRLEGDIAEANAELDEDDINVMLFHFPTTNAVLDNGVPSKKGVNLSEEITSNFNLCLGGDFHRPQQLINNDKAFYIGAPFDLKFNEQGERAFSIVEIGEDSFNIDRVTNIYNYEMISLDAEDVEEWWTGRSFLSNVGSFILKTRGDLDSELEEDIIGNQFCYDYLNAKTKAFRKVFTDTLVIEEKKSDTELVEEQLGQMEMPSDLKQATRNLFSYIFNRGEK